MNIHEEVELLEKCEKKIEDIFDNLDQEILSKIWYASNKTKITMENAIIRGAILNIYEKRNYKEVLD